MVILRTEDNKKLSAPAHYGFDSALQTVESYQQFEHLGNVCQELIATWEPNGLYY